MNKLFPDNAFTGRFVFQRRFSMNTLRHLLRCHWPIILLTIVLWLIIALTYKDYGMTWDEYSQLDGGKQYLAYLNSLFSPVSTDIYANLDDTAVTEMTRGFVADAFILQLMRQVGNLSLGAYHFFLAILASTSLALTYLTVYLLTKSRFASIIAAVFLITSPRFYGHMFNNSKDIQLVYLTLVAAILAIYYYTRKTGWLHWSLIGFIFGYGISQRIGMAHVFLAFAITALIFRRRIPTQIYRSLVVVGLVLIATMHLFSPYLHRHPIVGLFSIAKLSFNFPWNGTVLYFGRHLSAQQLPWHYLPVWIGITSPLLTLALSLVGSLLLIKQTIDRRISPAYFFILLLLWLPLVIVWVTRPVLYDGWRHFAFLSVPLTVLAALAIDRLVRQTRPPSLVSVPVAAAVAIQTALVLKSMIGLHPYQYIYFNSLVGGLRGAAGQFETDYWGQSYKEAIDWIKDNRQMIYPDQVVSVYACAFPPQSSYYFDTHLVWSSDPAQADFTVCYTRNDDHQKLTKGEIVHTVSRDSAPLNIIRTPNKPTALPPLVSQ